MQVIFPDELKAQYFILFFVLGMAFSAELGITSYTSIKIANALNGVSYTKVSNVHKFRFDSVKLILSNSLRILAVIYGFLATIVIFYLNNVSVVYFSKLDIALTLAVIFLTFINLMQQSLYDGVGLLYLYQIRSILINLLSLLFFCALTFVEVFHLSLVYYFLFRTCLVCLANHTCVLALDRKLLFNRLSSRSIFQIFKDKFFRRISVSWVAGSISFAAVIPLLALYHDIFAINEFGIIFQIFNAILAMSLSWQIGAQPFFVNDWLRSDKQKLLRHVRLVGLLSSFTSLILITAAIITVSIAAGRQLIVFNEMKSLSIILLSLPFLTFSAAYIHGIRADQKEIFMEVSIATCLLILCSVLLTFFLISLDAFAMVFATAMIIHSSCCLFLSSRYIQSQTLR